MTQTYVHIHLVSDSTGETLITIARAAMAQFESVIAVEHYYPMVRSDKQLARVMEGVQEEPGIVMHTIVDKGLVEKIDKECQKLNIPSIPVLEPVFQIFQTYLNRTASQRVGGQHVMNSDYFQRIEALNYTMAHDDGQMSDELDKADVIIVGVSRTSKTPTSIYLANRGLKIVNIPLVPDIDIPDAIYSVNGPLIVGLMASTDRLVQIRENRLLTINALNHGSDYVDRRAVSMEISLSRKLFRERGWPVIDVTRRSIEETAAEIYRLYQEHKEGLLSKMVEDSQTSGTEV